MKVRTLQELGDMLDESLAWRKKEILDLHLAVDTARIEQRGLLRRVAIPILYAHWEGFVKESAMRYVAYVRQRRLSAGDLRPCFLLLSVHAQLRELARGTRASDLAPIIEVIASPPSDVLNFPYRNVIATESNLNSEVLRNILFCCGLEFTTYWTTRSLMLDGSLLRVRNEIAHGSRANVDNATYLQLHVFVLEILETFKTELENAAATRAFRRVA